MDIKEVFTSQEELNECLKWWKEKLFLTDWIIKAKIAEPHEFVNEDCCGENNFDGVNKCCFIRILDEKYYGDCVMKYCAERILVHELLHAKYNNLDYPSTYEGAYVDMIDHGLLEQMAKSLIMVKYGLDFDYFIA